MNTVVQFFRSWPPELGTMILAALPVTELRAALPLGMTVFGLSPWEAFVWAVLGNLIPIPIILGLLPPIVRLAERRFPRFHDVLIRYFRSLEDKNRASYDTWGAVALAIFVAIPLPGTGSWTAAVLAVLFNIRRPVAAASIAIGVLFAGLAVLAVTVGVAQLF